MSSIKAGEREIGLGKPVFVIAEASINHNGSLERAKKLIDAAVSVGADAVKFQKRNLAEVYQKKVLDNPNQFEQKYQYLIPLLQEFELPDEAFVEMEKYAQERGIMFLVNGWDAESVKWLEENLSVPLYKVGSPDMTNDELLEVLVATGKPLIISTGMSHESEVEHCVQLMRKLSAEFILLHANNTYPAPFDEINLKYMDKLAEHGVAVGYSGHERGTSISIGAVARGACVIERHLTVDKSLEGPDHKASLLPEEFAELVKGIREVEQARGDGVKVFGRAEVMNREILAKSVVAKVFIADGTEIKREMLTTKSPAKGLSPQKMKDLIGVKAQRDIFAGEPLTEDDLTGEEWQKDWSSQGITWKWGPVVRFSDFREYLKYEPDLFEFHLSDQDLKEKLPEGQWQQQLVVHAPEYMGRVYLDPASEDPEILQISRETLKRTVELTKELGKSFSGKPKLVVHPGGITLEKHENPKKLLDNFRETLLQIASPEVEILPENLPPRPWVFGGEWVGNIFQSADEINQFLKETGYKMCLDTSHLALACNALGLDLANQVEQLKSQTSHLHVSDGAGVGEEGLQIGEGTIDWKQIMEKLKDYSGTMVPEIWQGHLHGGRGFLQAMEHLKQYIK